MDLTQFYGTLAGIEFTLLGLWWVVVRERSDLRDAQLRTGRLAYIVSLQFAVPGVAALLAQIAPDVPLLWRSAFTLAGILGALAIVLLAPTLSRNARLVRNLLMIVGVPLHCLVAIVAVVPGVPDVLGSGLTALQIEALLSSLLVFLSVQTSWAAAMTPSRAGDLAGAGPREFARP